MFSISNFRHSFQKIYNVHFGLLHTLPILMTFFVNYLVTHTMIYSLIGTLPAIFFFASPSHYVPIRSFPKFIYIFINIFLSLMLGCMANYNLWFSILLNIVTPFIMVHLFSDQHRVNGFMFYYAMFIGPQFVQLPLTALKVSSLTLFIGTLIPFTVTEILLFIRLGKNQPKLHTFKQFIQGKISFNRKRLIDAFNLSFEASRFAIRLSIASFFTIVLWKYVGATKWNWLTITTCCTLYPIGHHVSSRINARLIGSMIGIAIFYLLSLFTGNTIFFVVAGILAIFLMLSSMATNHLVYCYLFAAFVTLAFSILSYPSTKIILYKLLYTLLGSLLAFLFNRFILPSPTKNIT